MFYKNRFNIFVAAGDSVEEGQTVTFQMHSLDRNQTIMAFSLYATKFRQVRYTDERGVTKVGEIAHGLRNEVVRGGKLTKNVPL